MKWINTHPMECPKKELWKDYDLETSANTLLQPVTFSFDVFAKQYPYEGVEDVTFCPFCGAELIHYIERYEK